MNITISGHSAKAKSYSALVFVSISIIMIYLIGDIANYPRGRALINNLPAQEQGSPRISEVKVPLPVPTPTSLQAQAVSTPIPPEPVQVIPLLVPQPVLHRCYPKFHRYPTSISVNEE